MKKGGGVCEWLLRCGCFGVVRDSDFSSSAGRGCEQSIEVELEPSSTCGASSFFFCVLLHFLTAVANRHLINS